MSRHVNIPIFIPHLGCPNQCVFCNQRTISGVNEFKPEDVKQIIEDALATASDASPIEIAFFGGSFTGIDRELMVSLLKTAYSYVEAGAVESIRCSTRPDYIDSETLEILRQYGVKTIELGLQSTSDKVLQSSKRGHNFKAEDKACRLIVDSGFELVGQMMIGLPDSDIESELKTADFIISSGANAARIYPTVVFRETELCAMAISGEYTPLSLDEAVSRSAAVFERLTDAGVNVIRVGLQSGENLSSRDTYFAGPNHSALGELVIGELYYNRIMRKLSDVRLNGRCIIEISVSRGSYSKAVGHKKKNKLRLTERYPTACLSFVESNRISDFEVSVNIIDGENKCI